MQNSLLASISLTLLFVASSSAEFVSPYADTSLQTAEERLKTTSLTSVELQKEIARKKAIEDAKKAEAKKIKDAEIAKSFTKESDLKETEIKMINIAKGEKVKIIKAPVKKDNVAVNLQEDAFFENMKSGNTKTMKMD